MEPDLTKRRNQSPRLSDSVRHAIRLKHYSYRTEQTYLQWIKRYPLSVGTTSLA